jgi:glutathione-regulated potassium-efflux system ancillary protein KefF
LYVHARKNKKREEKMKKTLIILGHPDVKGGSIANKVIVNRLEELENIEIRNLAKLYPDFKIDTAAEQDSLLKADLICFQFPFYWYSVPAILKSWQDQVLAYGFAYGSDGDKLNGKDFLISTTIGGPEESYCKDGYNNFRISELLRPLEQMANLTGMKFNEPIISHNMIYIPGIYNEEKDILARANEHAEKLVNFIKK